MKLPPGMYCEASLSRNHRRVPSKDECTFGISSFEDKRCKFSTLNSGIFSDDPSFSKMIPKDTLPWPPRMEKKEGLYFTPGQHSYRVHLENEAWKRLDVRTDRQGGSIARSSSYPFLPGCIPLWGNKMNAFFDQASSTLSGFNERDVDDDDDGNREDSRAVDEAERGDGSPTPFRRVRTVRLKSGRTYPEEARKRGESVGKQDGNSLGYSCCSLRMVMVMNVMMMTMIMMVVMTTMTVMMMRMQVEGYFLLFIIIYNLCVKKHFAFLSS